MFSNKSIWGIAGAVILSLLTGGVKLVLYQARQDVHDQKSEERELAFHQANQQQIQNDIDRMNQKFENNRIVMPPRPQISNPAADLDLSYLHPPQNTTPSHNDSPRQPTSQPKTLPLAIPGTIEEDPVLVQPPQSDNIVTSLDTTDIEAAEPAPEPLELTHSPMPDADVLQSYKRWAMTEDYSQWLGEESKLSGWRFKPSTEFNLDRKNTRAVNWDVKGGMPGVGLDIELFTLYPRDKGMASPIIENTEKKQLFRLGRRQVRAYGDAQITYKAVNGLLVWRIHVPPTEKSKLATCYYAAIVDEQMIVFTARYNHAKPQQITAFDAIVQTLQYTTP